MKRTMVNKTNNSPDQDLPKEKISHDERKQQSIWLSWILGNTEESIGDDVRYLRPDAQAKARLLYEFCITSGRKVSESVHSLFIIAEHYSSDDPNDLESPEVINGIPPFFKTLSNTEKAEFCYNQVTEELSVEALPVTVDSLLATRRMKTDDPGSSYAGRFVKRVTRYVTTTLMVIAILYAIYLGWNLVAPAGYEIPPESNTLEYATWIAFGCVGALVHLLNHALTTTRLQTFEISEERKVWPRLLLGGMFGYLLPWLLISLPGGMLDKGIAAGSVAAFFGGYSVRFTIGLLERVLAAIMPETANK